LVSTLQYNLNRQIDRARLFEVGLTFVRNDNGDLDQKQKIAGLIYGSKLPKGWVNDGDVDFFDIKGDVERLLGLSIGNQFVFEKCDVPELHPGQAASISLNGAVVGVVGAVHPGIQKSLDLRKPAYLFQIDVASIAQMQLPAFTELSRFPGTSRDIAVMVDAALPVSQLLASIQSVTGEWLKDVVIFDVYQGKGIEPGSKSVAMGLTWQHASRTLNEEEINQWMEAAIQVLVHDYNAILRG